MVDVLIGRLDAELKRRRAGGAEQLQQLDIVIGGTRIINETAQKYTDTKDEQDDVNYQLEDVREAR